MHSEFGWKLVCIWDNYTFKDENVQSPKGRLALSFLKIKQKIEIIPIGMQGIEKGKSSNLCESIRNFIVHIKQNWRHRKKLIVVSSSKMSGHIRFNVFLKLCLNLASSKRLKPNPSPISALILI